MEAQGSLSLQTSAFFHQNYCVSSQHKDMHKNLHPSPQQALTRSTSLVFGTDSQLPDCTVLVLFANVCLCVCSIRLQTPACVHSSERPGHRWADGLVLVIWYRDPRQCTTPALEEWHKEFQVKSDLTDSHVYYLGWPVPFTVRWHLIMHLSQQAVAQVGAQRSYIAGMLHFFHFQ